MAHPEPSFNRFHHWMKQRGHHLLFGAMLVALIALLMWWAFFFHSAIRREYRMEYRSLLLQTRLTALRLGQQKSKKPPSVGVYLWDSRLEIIPVRTSGRLPRGTWLLQPRWYERAIRPRPQAISRLQKKYRRRLLMLSGEGAFLGLCILLISIMLYQMILLERRSAYELQECWSRITHEIKTPITGLKAFLETLQIRDFSRQELDPLLQLAMTQIQRQERLATNLLRGQQLGHDSFRVETTTLEWTPVIEDFFAGDDAQLTEFRLELELLSSLESRVLGNAKVIREILNNLTDNALKYTEGPLVLQVRMEDEGAFLLLRLSDNGRGFETSMAETIFESYRSLRDELPSKIQGTGMGLYLSRKLARRMGGDLRATSPGQGQGAEFLFWLKKPEC